MEKQEMREMTTIEKIRKEFEEYKNQKKLDFGNFYFCNPSHQLVFTDSFSGKNYRQDSMKYTISYAAEIILSRIEADYAAKETKLQTLSERFIEETTVKGYYGNVGLGVYAISWLDKLTGITYKTDYNRLNIYGPYTQLYFFIKEECNKTLAKEETIVDRVERDCKAYVSQIVARAYNFDYNDIHDNIFWIDPVTKLKFTTDIDSESCDDQAEDIVEQVKRFHENQQSESGLDRMVAEVQEAIYNLLKKNAEEEKEREAKAEARKEAEDKFAKVKEDVDNFVDKFCKVPDGDVVIEYSNVSFNKDSTSAYIAWSSSNYSYEFEHETFCLKDMVYFQGHATLLLEKVQKELGLAS